MRWILLIKAWSDAAWEDFEYWMKQDKKTLKRILQLLNDIDRNGYDGINRKMHICTDHSQMNEPNYMKNRKKMHVTASHWNDKRSWARRLLYSIFYSSRQRRIENDL